MLCFIVSLISVASYIIAKYMHDVRLSHPNKDYLLTYLLAYLLTYFSRPIDVDRPR